MSPRGPEASPKRTTIEDVEGPRRQPPERPRRTHGAPDHCLACIPIGLRFDPGSEAFGSKGVASLPRQPVGVDFAANGAAIEWFAVENVALAVVQAKQPLKWGGATLRASLKLREPLMNADLPDRLSVDPRSPYHNAELLERGIGIRFNGEERRNIEEYCVSEGWVRVAAGKALDRRGQPMTIKLKGKVEPYWLPAAG